MGDNELARNDSFLLVAELAITRFRNGAFEVWVVAGVALLRMKWENVLNNTQTLSVTLRAVLVCEGKPPRVRLMASGADLMPLNKYFLVGVVAVAVLAPVKRGELTNFVWFVAVPAVDLHCRVFFKEREDDAVFRFLLLFGVAFGTVRAGGKVRLFWISSLEIVAVDAVTLNHRSVKLNIRMALLAKLHVLRDKVLSLRVAYGTSHYTIGEVHCMVRIFSDFLGLSKGISRKLNLSQF